MQILTVSQAVMYLRELLESDIVLGDIWLSGEVSGPRTQPSGHTYFTLKDPGSQIRSVLFRSSMMRGPKMVEFLTQGSQVIVHGRLTVYEARGELQIVVDFVQPEGVGLRHAQFERLRAQLEEEGLFDESRKRPLPPFPKRIGVATSPAGAVFHDICNVMKRRWPIAEVVLAPTPVQGPDAPWGVAAAIESLNLQGNIDVIIVARGGGSVEELWAFNEEPVARAVFGSLVPVVSAVGHETDVTICDYVADLRAPTPSAAAELVVPDGAQLLRRVGEYADIAFSSISRLITRNKASTVYLAGRSERGILDVPRMRQTLAGLEGRALEAMFAAERDRRAHLRRSNAQLAALDPQATLNRGYAVVHKGGSVISSITDVTTGDALVIKVADGGFPASVAAGGAKRRAKTRDKSNGANGSTTKEPVVQPVLFP